MPLDNSLMWGSTVAPPAVALQYTEVDGRPDVPVLRSHPFASPFGSDNPSAHLALLLLVSVGLLGVFQVAGFRSTLTVGRS